MKTWIQSKLTGLFLGVAACGVLAGWYFLSAVNKGDTSPNASTENTSKNAHRYPTFTADGEIRKEGRDQVKSAAKREKKVVQVAAEKTPQQESSGYEEEGPLAIMGSPLPDVEVPSVIGGIIARLNEIKSPSQADRKRLRDEFRKWASEDGEGALITALSEFPRGDLRLEAAMASIRGWAQVDLTAAADYVASLHTPQQDYLVYNTAADYGQQDGQNAVKWALKDVPIEYRNGAAQHAMLSWAGEDSQAAINWLGDYVANEMRGGRAEKTMVWEAVFSYSADSLQGARSFVESLVQVDAMEAGVNAVVDRWMDADRIAAGNWIQEMAGKHPDLPLDDVYQLYAMQEAEVDPQNALEWAQAITDERKRTRAVEAVEYKIQQRAGVK